VEAYGLTFAAAAGLQERRSASADFAIVAGLFYADGHHPIYVSKTPKA
jgi:hypothetical protein